MVGRIDVNKIVPTAPRGTSDSRTASTAFVTGGGAGPRVVLPSTNYPGNIFYASQLGSDSTGDGTVGNPWATPNHGMVVLASQFDFGDQDVTLQGVAGHAAFTATLRLLPWVGGGSLTYDGGGGSIAVNGGSTTVNGDAINNFAGALPGPFTWQNVTLSAGSGVAVFAGAAGIYKLGASVVFGTCGLVQVAAQIGGVAFQFINNNYTITGGAVNHILMNLTGTITMSNTKATLSGSPVFSGSFAGAQQDGVIFAPNFSFTGSTGAGSPRYRASKNGVIDTTGGGPLYFPGDSAGSTATGGQYL